MKNNTTDSHENNDKRPRVSSTVILWITVLVAYLWMTLTMSLSGITSWLSSVGIFPAFSLACYAFFILPRKGILNQILGALAFALVVFMLIKNLADVLLPLGF